jgi:predicted DNA-binding transcriptional regulator AlpA
MSAFSSLPLPYLRTQEAARFIGVSRHTLEMHRSKGTGPKYSKVGGRVIYTASDLREWVKLGAVLPHNRTPLLEHGEVVAEIDAVQSAQLDTQEAARFLGLSPRTLEKHRNSGTGPKYSRVRRRAFYTLSDLREWAQRPASDPGRAAVLPATPVKKRRANLGRGLR